MQKLHKYQVLEKIGVGGFGVVYKASDPFIKRFVAIKTCTAADSETRDRFLREAEIAGNLHHRNIVTVYEFGFDGETPFLVQEYLSGEDLDRKIKRRDFIPPAEKLLYLVQIARGLEYAHAQGVIHRDIKPANIRILEDDTAKIMDFGIAKLARQQQSLTQAGITLGTAAYLSPEQIRGEPSDARDDIFSFGALAYELISYEKPFPGAEISAVFYKILNEPPEPLERSAPDSTPELRQIIMRCLEKGKADRYPDCGLLVRELEELTRRRPAAPAAAPRTESTRPIAVPTDTAPVPTVRTKGAVPRRRVSLGEIELDPAARAPAKSATTTAHAADVRRGPGWGTALAVALLLAAAARGAWRYFDQKAADRVVAQPAAQPTATSPTPTVTGDTAPPASDASRAAPASDATGEVAGAPGGLPPTTPPDDTALSGAATGAADRLASATTAPAPEPPPEAAPPPPPEPARVVLSPGWDSAIELQIGKRRWTLDRERTIELPPGSYRLQFSIASPAYSHREETRLRLAAGETRRLTPPIERPGQLTIQPHLNTRQGTVRLDGADAGSTPLRGRWLAPGPHVVEITAGPEPGSPVLLRETVEIASDRESILTFDLDGRLDKRLAARPILPN
ncbi:MAG: serine/threonine-protein kinase [Thermoanaerobaculia bacterium]